MNISMIATTRFAPRNYKLKSSQKLNKLFFKPNDFFFKQGEGLSYDISRLTKILVNFFFIYLFYFWYGMTNIDTLR